MNHRGYFIIDPDGVVQSMLVNNPSVGRSYEELFRLLAGLIHIRKNTNEALPCDWMPGDKVLVSAPTWSATSTASGRPRT